MPPVTLSARDAALLRRAAQAVIETDSPHAAAAERALARLSHRPAQARPPTAPRLAWALSTSSSDEGHLAALAQAVLTGGRVTFRYRTGETFSDQTRRVECRGLGYRNGAWYFAGFDIDRRDVRVFRVGRIAGDV